MLLFRFSKLVKDILKLMILIASRRNLFQVFDVFLSLQFSIKHERKN